ncbi:unnamed protein product [Rhizophagus irregularis]|nr:unnamed protein product [Rhizophagus irregularis]
MEIQTLEVELSSKSFELQTVKTECGVYKQHVSDMAEQSLITKYQTLIPFPEKQNKEMLGVVSANYHFYTLPQLNITQ